MSKTRKTAGGVGIGVIVLAFLALLGGGFTFGLGGNGTGDGDNSTVIESEQESQDEQQSGEEDINVLFVTVSGSDYYYENEKIAFDDLIKAIEEEDGEVLVEIKDEDASKNAYQKLIDKLDDLHIDYREK